MGALVEGLDDYVESELERIRAELREAIDQSDYTFEQIAGLAGVGVSTLYAILTGRHASGGGLDTLLRVAFIVGVRVELSESSDRSFQVVPLDSISSRSGSLSGRSETKNLSARGRRQSKKSTAEQRKLTARRKARNSWFSDLAA